MTTITVNKLYGLNKKEQKIVKTNKRIIELF